MAESDEVGERRRARDRLHKEQRHSELDEYDLLVENEKRREQYAVRRNEYNKRRRERH